MFAAISAVSSSAAAFAGYATAQQQMSTATTSHSNKTSTPPKQLSKKKKHKIVTSEGESNDSNERSTAMMHQQEVATHFKRIKATFDTKGPQDFEKLRLLGKGGVGRVYLVQLKGTNKRFAMKVLRQEEMIARNKVKRVLTEREVLATIRHPLIVSLYCAFQSKSRLYFVMEYCAGGDFYHVIQTQPHKCLTEAQTRFYAAEVLLALEYLHASGFVYRDLKPENILLHASGHIRLSDFDLSKASATPVSAHVVHSLMGSSNSSSSSSSDAPILAAEPSLVTNSFVGTEEYMAPEVIEGDGYGASVDWWTFGVLLYEMLYGVTPFRGKNRNDTFHRIETFSTLSFPKHPSSGAHLSKDCKNLIKRLLTRDPSKRLGFEDGAAEIKAHPFFKGVQFHLILNTVPPFIPEVLDSDVFTTQLLLASDDEDGVEGDADATKDAKEVEEGVNPDDLDAQHPFKAFAPIDRVSDNGKTSKSASFVTHSDKSRTALTSSKDAKKAFLAGSSSSPSYSSSSLLLNEPAPPRKKRTAVASTVVGED